MVTETKPSREAEAKIPESGTIGLARANNTSTEGNHGRSLLGRIKDGIAKGLQDLSGIFEDYILWLILLLLLLAWLFVKSRKRDEENYQHDARKRFASRKVVTLQA